MLIKLAFATIFILKKYDKLQGLSLFDASHLVMLYAGPTVNWGAVGAVVGSAAAYSLGAG